MNLRFLLREWINPYKVFLLKWKHSVAVPLSLSKTVYLNFKLLPFRQAIHLPIFIYRHTLIYELGKMEIISDKINTGMIRWGRMNVKSMSRYGKIRNEGKITFTGDTKIGGSTLVENRGHIIFGENVWMTERVSLMIRSKLEIGKGTVISPGCVIYDSSDHYTIDVKTKVVKRNTLPIKIGDYNWLCSETYVKKGTLTGPYTISAAFNTLLCKDYSLLPPYTILGGSPAEPIGKGVRTILNLNEELRIKKFFDSNPQIDELKIDIEDNELEQYCTSNLRKI